MYVIKHNIAILYLLLSSTVCEKNVICFDEKCVSSHAAKVESPLHVQLCFYDNLLPNNPTSWELNSFCKNQYKLSGDSDSSTNIEIAPLITIVYSSYLNPRYNILLTLQYTRILHCNFIKTIKDTLVHLIKSINGIIYDTVKFLSRSCHDINHFVPT